MTLLPIELEPERDLSTDLVRARHLVHDSEPGTLGGDLLFHFLTAWVQPPAPEVWEYVEGHKGDLAVWLVLHMLEFAKEWTTLMRGLRMLAPAPSMVAICNIIYAAWGDAGKSGCILEFHHHPHRGVPLHHVWRRRDPERWAWVSGDRQTMFGDASTDHEALAASLAEVIHKCARIDVAANWYRAWKADDMPTVKIPATIQGGGRRRTTYWLNGQGACQGQTWLPNDSHGFQPTDNVSGAGVVTVSLRLAKKRGWVS